MDLLAPLPCEVHPHLFLFLRLDVTSAFVQYNYKYLYLCIKFLIFFSSAPAGFKTLFSHTIKSYFFVTPHNHQPQFFHFLLLKISMLAVSNPITVFNYFVTDDWWAVMIFSRMLVGFGIKYQGLRPWFCTFCFIFSEYFHQWSIYQQKML